MIPSVVNHVDLGGYELFMKTLRIVGSGMKGLEHFTQEVIEVLGRTNKILWLGTIIGMKELIEAREWIGEEISAYYRDGDLDSDNYERIKKKVFSELEEMKDVTLVVQGHPRFGVSIVQEVQEEADFLKIDLHIYPGISSFDTMINDLLLDPIEEGSCVVDANRLILYDYEMDTSLNYFIYHVCSIGNSNTDYTSPACRNAAYFLIEKLKKHYSEDHEIVLIASCQNRDSYKTNIKKSQLKGLAELLSNVSFDSSLFIAATLPKRNKINKEFYKYIKCGLMSGKNDNTSECS